MQGYQVTLTTQNTAYHLLTLVRALDTSFVDVGDFVVQAHDDGGAQIFYLGGSAVDSTHFGQSMTVGDFGPHLPCLGGTYATCDTASKKLNISVVRG